MAARVRVGLDGVHEQLRRSPDVMHGAEPAVAIGPHPIDIPEQLGGSIEAEAARERACGAVELEACILVEPVLGRAGGAPDLHARCAD